MVGNSAVNVVPGVSAPSCSKGLGRSGRRTLVDGAPLSMIVGWGWPEFSATVVPPWVTEYVGAKPNASSVDKFDTG